MLDAAIKALSQMISPPFRAVLFKSMGLAVALLIVVAIGLQRVLSLLVDSSGLWLETTIGSGAHGTINFISWILAFVAGAGVVAGAVFLVPAATSLVASFFVDEIAALVEKRYYPDDPPGIVVPLGRALIEGLKAAFLAIIIYLCAIPFLLVAGLGIVIFFLANAFLLGRIYFEFAAMRFHPAGEAKRLRRIHQGTIFLGGMFIAAFVSIPIVNLATPLFGTALMVHVHKRIIGRTHL
ncbi:MAG TPA: sulfate transporter family protein [Xanthobacteraceae bacterium]|jgi:uncharacterized protein involved in cysteine biosynthesis|nr:sulfate transporter family protein [Xanthobacteraceae bacterium]